MAASKSQSQCLGNGASYSLGRAIVTMVDYHKIVWVLSNHVSPMTLVDL